MKAGSSGRDFCLHSFADDKRVGSILILEVLCKLNRIIINPDFKFLIPYINLERNRLSAGLILSHVFQ